MERIPRFLDCLEENLHALRILCTAWNRSRLVVLVLAVPLAALPFAA